MSLPSQWGRAKSLKTPSDRCDIAADAHQNLPRARRGQDASSDRFWTMDCSDEPRYRQIPVPRPRVTAKGGCLNGGARAALVGSGTLTAGFRQPPRDVLWLRVTKTSAPIGPHS